MIKRYLCAVLADMTMEGASEEDFSKAIAYLGGKMVVMTNPDVVSGIVKVLRIEFAFSRAHELMARELIEEDKK